MHTVALGKYIQWGDAFAILVFAFKMRLVISWDINKLTTVDENLDGPVYNRISVTYITGNSVFGTVVLATL